MRPPRWLESAVGFLLPPGDREYILGDLLERARAGDSTRASRRLLADAASVIPAAVAARLRRTIGWRVVAVEAVLLLTLFGTAAFSVSHLSGLAFLTAERGLLRLLVPALVTFTAVTLWDVYLTGTSRGLWRQFVPVGAGVFAAICVNAALGLVATGWDVPPGMMVWAVGMAIPLMSVLRWIAHGGVRPQAGHDRWSGYAVTVIIVAAFLRSAILAPNPIQRIGACLTVAAGIHTAWRLAQHRARNIPIKPWARIVVFLPGPILFSIGHAVAHPNVLPSVLVWIAAFVTLAVASLRLRTKVDPS